MAPLRVVPVPRPRIWIDPIPRWRWHYEKVGRWKWYGYAAPGGASIMFGGMHAYSEQAIRDKIARRIRRGRRAQFRSFLSRRESQTGRREAAS